MFDILLLFKLNSFASLMLARFSSYDNRNIIKVLMQIEGRRWEVAYICVSDYEIHRYMIDVYPAG